MHGVFTTLALLALLLVTIWCWFQWKFRRIISNLSKLRPLSPTWPIIGHIPIILKGHVGFSDTLFKLLQESGEMREKNVSFWFGPYPYIFVGEGKDIETVLCSKKCGKSFHYEFLKVILGNGLLTSPDDIHKITRRHVNPMFTLRNLESFSQEFNASGRNLTNTMSKHVGRGLVDVAPMVFPHLIKTIGDFLLGPGVLPEEGSEVFKEIIDISMGVPSLVANRMECFWLWPDAMFNIFYGKYIDSAMKALKKYSNAPLEAMEKKKIPDNNSRNNGTSCTEEKDPVWHITLPEVYDGLKRDYPQFTNQDMQYELFTLLETGSHTSNVQLAALFLALATHPDIQERLYQEVVSVVGTEDSDVTTEDFKRMPYLEQVLKETLRKFVIIPMVIRKSNEDLQLSDVTVPAGTMIVLSLITQQYDTEVFPDPHSFNPERFSPENMAKMNKYNFKPYASGSRNCVGGTYATIIAKTMAVHVIRKFKLSSSVDVNKLKYSWAIAKSSVDGYHLELHSREPTQKT